MCVHVHVPVCVYTCNVTCVCVCVCVRVRVYTVHVTCVRVCVYKCMCWISCCTLPYTFHLLTDAKMSPAKSIECDSRPPEGAIERLTIVSERLLCVQRDQLCNLAVSGDVSQNSQQCTHISVHNQRKAIGGTQSEKERRQLASRPTVPTASTYVFGHW